MGMAVVSVMRRSMDWSLQTPEYWVGFGIVVLISAAGVLLLKRAWRP